MAAPSFAHVVAAGLGGFVGSALRFLASGWVHDRLPGSSFPWGTLAVNMAGCLAIGLLAGAAESRQLLGPTARVFLLIGVLGGFTTYSSFAFETVGLALDAGWWRAAGNVVAHLALGLGAAWLAYGVGRAL